MTIEPKYAPMPTWIALSGMTRTASYQAWADGNLRFIKQPGGRRTLVDVEHGLAWLRSQPAVVSPRTGQRRKAEAATAA
jgi:hypothetical protein